MFKKGTVYTRATIHASIGGNHQACLLTKAGHVVGVCFVKGMNPQGPEVILVGRGPQKENAAAILAKQPNAVPVFVKNETNRWEYLGLYRGEGYEALARKEYVAASGRSDVVGRLRLRSVDQ